MATRKKEDPVAADDPHVSPLTKADTTAASGDLAEYEVDGSTFLLSPEDAEKRGAKAVGKPENKAVNPQNK